MPLFIVFGALVLTFRQFRFSDTAYVLMSMWLFLHMIGAKYTFANVPFDWGNQILAPLLGEGRNHFDRFRALYYWFLCVSDGGMAAA